MARGASIKPGEPGEALHREARQLEFAPQGAHILARQKPADDAELELSVENTGRLDLDMGSPMENCP